MTTPTDPTTPNQTPETPPAAPVTPEPSVDESGYPANTPVAEMTDKQAAAYWKSKSRQWENRTKGMADYDTLKSTAEQYAKLVEASKTDAEKAIDAAKADARSEVLREVGSRLVDAEITAASAGRMTDNMRTALLQGLDRTRFLTDSGEVDSEKVKTFVDGIVPANATPAPAAPVDLGQGKRGSNSTPSLADGVSLYDQRHPKK